MFFKDYVCKHIIGLAIRQKEVKPPRAVNDVPIGQKRPRGRPRLAASALVIQ